MIVKIVSLKDQIVLLLQLGDGDIARLTSPISTHAKTHTSANFLSGSREFYKIWR